MSEAASSPAQAMLGRRVGPGASPTRIGWWLFVAFALLYVLTMHGRAFSDSRYHFEQIETLYGTGHFVMWEGGGEPLPRRLEAWTGQGVDGHWYSLLPPGQALTATPLAGLGRVVGWPELRTGAPGVHDAPMMFWASLLMPLAMAAMLVAVFHAAVSATGLVSRGLQAACVLGLATNTWFYATTFWTRPLAAACLVGSLALVLQARDRTGRWGLAGALLGWALVIRPDMVFAAPWLVGLACVRGRGQWRALVAYVAPIGLCVLGLMLWNEHRFGDALSTGSPHQTSSHYKLQYLRWELPRILFGEKGGLFRYVPVLVLTAFAIPAAWRHQRAVLITCLGASATLAVFYAAYVWGRSAPPIAWGGRHLYPIVPLLLLPAFMVRDHAPLRPIWAWVLVGASVPWQLYGVWQKESVQPVVWWLDEPRHAVAATLLAAALAFSIHRLVSSLDLKGPAAPPSPGSEPNRADASERATALDKEGSGPAPSAP